MKLIKNVKSHAVDRYNHLRVRYSKFKLDLLGVGIFIYIFVISYTLQIVVELELEIICYAKWFISWKTVQKKIKCSFLILRHLLLNWPLWLE